MIIDCFCTITDTVSSRSTWLLSSVLSLAHLRFKRVVAGEIQASGVADGGILPYRSPIGSSPNLPPHSEIPINPIGGSPSPGLPSFQPLPIGGTTHFTSASGQYVKASEAKQKKNISRISIILPSFYHSKLGGENFSGRSTWKPPVVKGF